MPDQWASDATVRAALQTVLVNMFGSVRVASEALSMVAASDVPLAIPGLPATHIDATISPTLPINAPTVSAALVSELPPVMHPSPLTPTWLPSSAPGTPGSPELLGTTT